MIRRSVLLVVMIAAGVQAWAATFDRQAFLAAVKERIKAEPRLMELRSANDPLLIVKSDSLTTEGWQKDLASITGLSLPSIGQNATFGVALAYVTSEELSIQLASPGSRSLIWLQGDGRGQNVSVVLNDGNFGTVLLRAVFDQRSCSIQPSDLTAWTRITPQFANSICKDLKQVVADARSEFKDQQLLASEKEAAGTAIQRAEDLLKQVPGYENSQAVETSIASLEASITSNDLSEIRSKEQALVSVSLDLEQIVATQHASDEALANARQAANRELTRTQTFLAEAKGYNKRDQVASAQQSLELALVGENAEEIQTKTRALEAADRELDQFIQAQRGPVHAEAHVPEARITRRLSEAFWNALMIALAVNWLYCFYRGFTNQIVLYFDKKDVFLSILGPVALLCSYWGFEDGSYMWGFVFLAAGAVASLYTIRSSMVHNGSVAIGCVVGVFKVTFSLLWLGLVVGQLGRGGDKNQSNSERERQQIFGFIVFLLLLWLMDKLINGPAVYAQRRETSFQPA